MLPTFRRFAPWHLSPWARGHPFAALRACPELAEGAEPGRPDVTLPSRRDLWSIFARCTILALILTAVAAVAHADSLDDETRRIAKQLQCPVCAGAPVSDSPSDLAGQMRTVIRAKLEAGESEEQIIAYFVERYGDSVLSEPPRRGIGLIVWVAPIAMLAVGGVLLWRILRAWLRPRHVPSLVSDGAPIPPYRNGTARVETSATGSSLDRARAELDQLRREV